jgi:hypothetical protein
MFMCMCVYVCVYVCMWDVSNLRLSLIHHTSHLTLPHPTPQLSPLLHISEDILLAELPRLLLGMRQCVCALCVCVCMRLSFALALSDAYTLLHTNAPPVSR